MPLLVIGGQSRDTNNFHEELAHGKTWREAIVLLALKYITTTSMSQKTTKENTK